jgi:hypothetical protein
MKKLTGIEYDINVRWENGVEHHESSKKLMERINQLDWEFLNGYFDFKTGGDGDNGETLMYLLDIYFEELDLNKQGTPRKLKCE